ncbi:probable peroxygenase 5 isoform X2 [Arachis hypogaea]|uniref:probable peroxygenase 5 isoform X2 n=1 Tax=Arachis hypogaea TaxID=3818 RepID=UPI003B215494
MADEHSRAPSDVNPPEMLAINEALRAENQRMAELLRQMKNAHAKGLREIGVGILLSIGGTLFINVFLSRITRPGKFPSPLLPIEVKNIQLGKHGSDTGVYDTEGRFVPSKFEKIFIKHAHTHPNALTYDELKEMIKANRQPKDLKGRIGSFVEWHLLYKIGKDKDGLLQKETIRGVYDGSVFEILKKEHSSDKNN